MSRAYTVKEIDALRRVIGEKLIWGRYRGPTGNFGMSGSYNQVELDKRVEERIRTSMIAGHTAQDLLDSEGPTS